MARELPGLAGRYIADVLHIPSDTVVAPLARAMETFLARAGDQRAVVDRTIARIAAEYRQNPPSRLSPPPPLPEFIEPETESEARERLAHARAALVAVRMRTRAGLLLTVPADRFRTAGLHHQ